MSVNVSNGPILVVEDNPVDLDLMLRAFEMKKLTNPIKIARDGEEALAYFDRWEKGEEMPVVILLDLNMPKIGGLEVLKEIKEHATFKSIPVVILTTSSDSKDLNEAYALGANSYIVKPVDFEKFIEVASQIDLYWRVLNKTDYNNI